MAEILETDLIEIFAQFSIKALFSTSVKNFTYIHRKFRFFKNCKKQMLENLNHFF